MSWQRVAATVPHIVELYHTALHCTAGATAAGEFASQLMRMMRTHLIRLHTHTHTHTHTPLWWCAECLHSDPHQCEHLPTKLNLSGTLARMNWYTGQCYIWYTDERIVEVLVVVLIRNGQLLHVGIHLRDHWSNNSAN